MYPMIMIRFRYKFWVYLYLHQMNKTKKATSFNRDPSSSPSFFPLSAHFSRFLCFHYLFFLCILYYIQLDRLCVLMHIKVPFLVAKKTWDNEWFTDFRDIDTTKAKYHCMHLRCNETKYIIFTDMNYPGFSSLR